MTVDLGSLPALPALLRLRAAGGTISPALWRNGALRDLSHAADPALHALDRLLALPVAEIRRRLERSDLASLPTLDPARHTLLAPVESQEVWAAGVTYVRSREARMEEAAVKDIYALVYEAERPELFFKAAGWRVVAPGGEVGVRSDSTWDVPEPELAVLSNAHGEVVAYACGNDMSSRSIEGENPLYLPQAKVYDDSCAIGPAAVLAWHVQPRRLPLGMTIERGGEVIYHGEASTTDLVRDPADLCGVLHAAYTLPAGAWLLTGTSLVPPDTYTTRPGDAISIRIAGLGELRNRVREVWHSGARAPAHLPPAGER